MREITHFIDGASVAGTSGRYGDIFNPNTGEVQARVALASVAEMDLAVASAVRAQQLWSLVNPQRRARVMFDFKRLVEANMTELAELLSAEHGKVVADSKGDIQRGLEVIEFACGIPHALKGEYTEGAGPGLDVYSRGTAAGKRVQAMGGAKNHGIVMPDADLDQAVKDISGAAFGSAGERCMALPVVVPVGAKTAEAFREKMLAEIETLKVGVSTDAAAQYGPVVTAAHRQKISDYIQLGQDEGAELVVDGPGVSLH